MFPQQPLSQAYSRIYLRQDEVEALLHGAKGDALKTLGFEEGTLGVVALQ